MVEVKGGVMDIVEDSVGEEEDLLEDTLDLDNLVDWVDDSVALHHREAYYLGDSMVPHNYIVPTVI